MMNRFIYRKTTLTGLVSHLAVYIFMILFYSCATTPAPDYSNFQKQKPLSILVLPPLNNTNEVNATNSYLSIVTEPIAEKGYYVYPVAVVDSYFKANGMPSAGEIHQIPVKKLRDVFGCDAVMYITIEKWGAQYKVIDSKVVVSASSKLVDARDNSLLWNGSQHLTDGSSSNNSSLGFVGILVKAAVKQAVNDVSNAARDLAKVSTAAMVNSKTHGFINGPRNLQTTESN